jgi:hypothetical protein
MFRKIREQSMRLVETLPSQYEYLTHMRGGGARVPASKLAEVE